MVCMSPIQQIIITVFSSVLASSGLWACIQARMTKKDVQTELLIGLAHDRIMYFFGGVNILKLDGFRQVIMTTCTNIYTFLIRKMGEMDLPKGSRNK